MLARPVSAARPGALLALWAAPSLLIAVLTVGFPPPAAAFAGQRPDPVEVLQALAALAAPLAAQLFTVVLLAGPTARLAQGASVGEAMRAMLLRNSLVVSAFLAMVLTFALLLTMVPGLMALFVNPLMGLIFLTVGTIGGAALAVGLFGRWMYAPVLAAEGRGAAEALDASRARARSERNFGAALGLAVAFAIVLGLAAAGGVAGDRGAGIAGRIVGTWLALWVGLAWVAGRVADRAAGAAQSAGAPRLALSRRPSACPRCGALAEVALALPAEVACGACGLRGSVR